MSDLPEQVDCVVLGTGLINSIIAASCARVGKSVLHLDDKSYYGDEWASFTFEQLLEWVDTQKGGSPSTTASQSAPSGQATFIMRKTKNDPIFSNVNVFLSDKLQQSHTSHQDGPEAPKRIKTNESNDGDGDSGGQTQSGSHEWTLDKLRAESKLFCIDLNPRLIYSNGEMVDLLVKSNVCRYHEFKNTVRLVSLIDDKLQVLPCKRNEVFSSQILPNLIDKRRLMKFLELCLALDDAKIEESELKDSLHKSIEQCLIERDLGPNLRHILINSIAMVGPNISTLVACKQIKKFLHSVEKFGKSPFLFPIYGCGEFPQSFCRMCAVFGGVYCLNKQVESLKIIEDTEENSGTNTRLALELDDGKIIKCQKLVLNYSHALQANMVQVSNGSLQSRAILIVTRSFYTNSDDHISLLRLPAGAMSNKYSIFLLEVNASVMVCPPGLSIVYVWARSNEGNATNELLPIVKDLYEKKKDNDIGTNTKGDIIWSCYYNKLIQSDDGSSCTSNIENSGITVTSLGSSDLTDYETTINEANKTFQRMFPGEEFLPRAPDPDEIVFDVQDVAT